MTIKEKNESAQKMSAQTRHKTFNFHTFYRIPIM